MRRPILPFILLIPLLTHCTSPAVSTTAPTSEMTPTVPIKASRVLQLPEWLKSPREPDIFIANGCPTKENCRLVLVNPGDGARFDLPIQDVAVYFWLLGGTGIGLVTNQQDFLEIDLASGVMVSATLPVQSLRFFQDALPSEFPRPAYALAGADSDEWFLVTDGKDFSFDHKRRVLQDFSQEETPLSIETLETGEVIQATRQDDGLYDVEYAWSPVSNGLAILQSAAPGVPALSGQVVYEKTRILLFDAGKKIAIGEFEGDYASLRWSPDGRALLYQTHPEDSPGYRQDTCLLNVQTGQSRCLDAIASQTSDAYNLRFQWLPDGSGLAYLKHASSGETAHFCIYQFKADRLECPSQDLPSFHDRKILHYSLSPDGRFVFLTSDTPYSSYDAPEMPLSAWMRINGQGFTGLWGEADFRTFGWNPAAVGVLWRPA